MTTGDDMLLNALNWVTMDRHKKFEIRSEWIKLTISKARQNMIEQQGRAREKDIMRGNWKNENTQA